MFVFCRWWVCHDEHSIYIRTVNSVCYFTKLDWIGYWTIWAEQHTPYSWFLPSPARIICTTKAKVLPSNLETVIMSILWWVLCYHFVDSSSRYVFRAKKIAVQEYISGKNTQNWHDGSPLSQSSRYIFRAKKISVEECLYYLTQWAKQLIFSQNWYAHTQGKEDKSRGVFEGPQNWELWIGRTKAKNVNATFSFTSKYQLCDRTSLQTLPLLLFSCPGLFTVG